MALSRLQQEVGRNLHNVLDCACFPAVVSVQEQLLVGRTLAFALFVGVHLFSWLVDRLLSRSRLRYRRFSPNNSFDQGPEDRLIECRRFVSLRRNSDLLTDLVNWAWHYIST